MASSEQRNMPILAFQSAEELLIRSLACYEMYHGKEYKSIVIAVYELDFRKSFNLLKW